VAQILIRNLPEDVMHRLRTKAELAGSSLEQTVRDMIVAHSPLSPEEKVALSRRFHAQFKKPIPSLSKEEIHEGLL